MPDPEVICFKQKPLIASHTHTKTHTLRYSSCEQILSPPPGGKKKIKKSSPCFPLSLVPSVNHVLQAGAYRGSCNPGMGRRAPLRKQRHWEERESSRRCIILCKESSQRQRALMPCKWISNRLAKQTGRARSRGWGSPTLSLLSPPLLDSSFPPLLLPPPFLLLPSSSTTASRHGKL